MRTAVLLPVYRAAARGLTPFSGVFLWRRGRKGKEDLNRIGERRGRASLPRPEGRLAWLHGASVGEGLALLPLVSRLTAKNFHVLVTTGTVTSARILAQRLPEGASHQFAPLDAPAFIDRFLDHWRPDLFVLAESEIWPNTICAVHARKIPITLVNARLSPRSFAPLAAPSRLHLRPARQDRPLPRPEPGRRHAPAPARGAARGRDRQSQI